MSTEAVKRLTWEEYLARERASDVRHEFYDGEVFAMAGGSRRHAVIIGNAVWSLKNALNVRSCEIYPNDMRVLCPNGLAAYPDVVVACGPEFDDKSEDTLLNPRAIVEVLSPSTEAYDRGKKFNSYRMIDSLREYLLVSQDQLLVEHYRRQQESDSWILTAYSNADEQVSFPYLDIELKLSDIYAQIDFSEDDAPPAETA